MERLFIETERLIITEFDKSMAEDVHKNSLDEDTRRFVPDEVLETVEDARKTILYLMGCYKGNTGPFVYPVLTKTNENIGYVQAIPTEEGWEIGYHIANNYTRNGYVTEAVKSFVPLIMKRLGIDRIYGLCAFDNAASCKVLENCGFSLIYRGTGDYQGNKREICRYSYHIVEALDNEQSGREVTCGGFNE